MKKLEQAVLIESCSTVFEAAEKQAKMAIKRRTGSGLDLRYLNIFQVVESSAIEKVARGMICGSNVKRVNGKKVFGSVEYRLSFKGDAPKIKVVSSTLPLLEAIELVEKEVWRFSKEVNKTTFGRKKGAVLKGFYLRREGVVGEDGAENFELAIQKGVVNRRFYDLCSEMGFTMAYYP